MRVFYKEERMRVTRTARRVWAILMSIVMVLSTIVVGKAPDAKAAPRGYTVTINFYDHDKQTPTNATDPEIPNGKYFILVEAKNDAKGWTTYAIQQVNFDPASPTTTVNIPASAFYCDQYNGPGHTFSGRDNNYWQGYYDTSPAQGYSMESPNARVRIYYSESGNIPLHESNHTEEELLAMFDNDSAPDGWAYCPSEMQSKKNEGAVISLYKSAYTINYELRVKYDGEGASIAEDDKYFAVVEVVHNSPGNTYFIQNLTHDGSSNTVTYPVTTWLDQNGNEKPTEKMTGHEDGRNVYIYKVKDGFDVPSNANFINKESMLAAIEAGSPVGTYTFSGVTSESVNDDVNYITTISDTINMSAIVTSNDYTYLTVLQNAVNYGVTANSIKQHGHSQTNLATNTFSGNGSVLDSNLSGPLDTNLHPEFSGSAAGVFLIGEIEDKLTIANETFGNPVIITSSEPLSDYVVDDTATHDKVIAVNADKTSINDAVNEMISNMQTVSQDMASHDPTLTPRALGENKYEIDTTGFPEDATIYINADDIVTAVEAGNITIKKQKNQVIVFNFKTTTHLSNIGELKVDYGDGLHTTNTVWSNANDPQNDYADQISRQIVWNMASVTKLDDTTRAGGMFLLPLADSTAEFGGASCGWIVSAGHVGLGASGEFHFVYRDLNPNSQARLNLQKRVNNQVPTAEQEFTFTLERYDADTKAFETLKTTDDESSVIDFTVQNEGGKITIPLTQLNEGQNVIRIKEVAKNGYKKNTQEIYAVFNVTVYYTGSTPIKIPGAVSYYTSFDATTGTPSDKLSSTPTFRNEVAENQGKIAITKTIKGDVTEEDLKGLKFEIFDEDDTLIDTVYLRDFHKGNPDSTDVKDKYTYSLDVDAGKSYYVVETLTTTAGFDVVVKNQINASEVTDAAATGTTSEQVAVATGETSNIAYENEYTLLPVSTTIEATKTLTDLSGTGKTLAEGDFTFQMVGQGLSVGTNVTKQNEADGTVSFGTFNYDTPGTYVYKIREIKDDPEKEGITYSEDSYTVTVEVTRLTDGTGLHLEKTVEKNGAAFTGDIEFINTYSEAKGYINLTKTIKGPVTDEDVAGLKFTIMKGEEEVTTRTLGTDFEEVSEGKWQLKEDKLIAVVPGDDYTIIETLTNNTTGFDVVVKHAIGVTEITDETATTESESTAQFSVIDGQAVNVAYENDYSYKPVSTDIEATKTLNDLSGTGKTLAEGDFTFQMVGQGLDAETTVTKQNEADGTVSFGTFNYYTEGTHVYTIREIKDEPVKEGITYSEDEYVVTITVTDQGQGKGLKLEKSVTKNGAAFTGDIEFVNEYNTVKGKLTVHVTEKNSGDDVEDAEVEIEYPDGTKKTYITDENGEVKDEDGNDLLVPPGTYKVTVTKVPEDYDVTTGETGTVIVPANEEGHHDAVIETDCGGIILTVLDEETGEPVTDATVEVTEPDGTKKEYTTDANGQVTEYGKKDKFGNYTAKPGSYTYKVTKVPTGYHVTVGEEQTDTVVPGQLKKLEAKIAPAPEAVGGLTVVVLDEETGEPVPDTTITVKKGEDEFTGKTDKDGRVTFNPIPTGEYTITISDVPTGYSVTTGDGGKKTVVENKIEEHEIRIIPKSSDDEGGLTVVVLDEETGEPVPDTTITVKKGDDVFTGKTDKDGRVTFNPIPTGEYTITITDVPTGYSVTTGDGGKKTVVKGTITKHEIKIVPKTPASDENGGLTIVVIDEVTGKVVPGAKLEITHNKDKSIKFTKTTDKDGKVTLNPIPTGDYTIVITEVPAGYTVSKNAKQIGTVVTGKITPYEIKITTATTTPNSKTSKEDTPKTGDDTPIRMHLLLMLISAAASSGLLFIKKKKKNEF